MKRIALFIVVIGLLALPMSFATAQTTVATGTVTTERLNVRTEPSVNAPVIAQVTQGYTAGVIGRNSSSTWYQLILPGGSGWVSGQYLAVTNAHTVPVTYNDSGVTPPRAEGYINTGALNVRSIPSPYNNEPLATFYRGTSVDIIGRNADSSWYQVVVGYGGITGWVNGDYIAVTNGNISSLPITSGGTTPPTPVPPPVGGAYAQGQVNTGALNIRPVPRWWGNTPITFIYRNTTVTVIGRNSDLTWYQVRLSDGTVGWARSKYISVTSGNVNTAPVTG